jgi:phosphatidate cytidylyltransferase
VATITVPNHKPLSELARRVAVAVVAIPGTIAIVWLGGLYLGVFTGVVAAVGAWELYRMARAGDVLPLDAAGIPLAAFLPILAVLEPQGVFTLPVGPSAIIILGLLVAAMSLRVPSEGGRPLSAVAVTVFGIIYTGGMLSFGIAIRYHDYAVGRSAGTALVMLPLVLTWTNDIGAYAFGRLFGRRKLIPSVSPGKTVAGAVGGTIVTVLVCWAYTHWVLRPVAELAFPPWWIAGVGLALSIAAQLGDLVESLLKREAGMKNSSGLVPGHGGVLDRIDSLLFVLPTAFVLFSIPGVLIPAPS